MRFAALIVMLTVAALGVPILAADTSNVTEDQKFTTPFAGEELGHRVDAYGLRSASEMLYGAVRHIWWGSVIGWGGSSVTSASKYSVDEGQAAMILSTTNAATMTWLDGEPSPPAQVPKYISVANATAVALDGDRLAISRQGAAWVGTYVLDGSQEWVLEHQFMGSTATNFGTAIDLYGDTLVIGIPRNAGSAAGDVEIWWNLDSPTPTGMTLYSPGGEAGNTFGAAVAIWGDWLAVGAPLEDTAFPQTVGTDVGATYVFARAPEIFVHRTTLYGDATGDHSGASLDLKEITLVVGAPLADVGSPYVVVDVGEAYVHRRYGELWTTLYRLRASDMAAHDQFGSSVAIATTGILVGAPYARGTSGENDAGGVYCYYWLANGIFVDDFEHGTGSAWSNVVQ